MMKRYMVQAMDTHAYIEVKNCTPSLKEKIPLCYAEGMVGALPVFETREQAEAFDTQNAGIAELDL